MTFDDIAAMAAAQGFALRLSGENVSIVGMRSAPKKLVNVLKPAKDLIVHGLKANPPEKIKALGFLCPHCQSSRMEVHDAGLVCEACAKMAFVFYPSGSMVRADFVTD